MDKSKSYDMKQSKNHLEHVKTYRLKNLEKIKAYRRSEKYRAYTRNYQRRLRLKCLDYYGNSNPKCACCGETEIKFLTIDHINNDGAKHRKMVKTSNIYQWLVKNKFPEGFQLLCYNCNCSKGFYGECPHKNIK